MCSSILKSFHAKDGSTLPDHRQAMVMELPRVFVGETADFLWTPDEPGEYVILIGPQPTEERSIAQRWTVRAAEDVEGN